MDEWEDICNWIKALDGCPEDAKISLCMPDDGRLWIEVLSFSLMQENYERETNTGDPIWNTFNIITTHEHVMLKHKARQNDLG